MLDKRRFSWHGMSLLVVLFVPRLLLSQARVEKIDSLIVRLAMPRERALDAVVGAFLAAGLRVINTTPSIIETDEGSNAGWGQSFHRVVRAILVGAESATTVIIYGEERRHYSSGGTKRLRIDNRAGGNGGKVWAKMVDAAWSLDSTAVPQAAYDRDNP
jgi:hypothetical protein